MEKRNHNWLYQGKAFTKLPEGVCGFVYTIYYTDGRKYIGKKLAISERKKNLGKKELELQTDQRLKKHKHVVTEHKWQQYEGSSKETEGLTIQSKVITHLCTNKLTMSYLETKNLMAVDAPMNPDYLNKIIGKTYWDNALDGLYKEAVQEQPTLF